MNKFYDQRKYWKWFAANSICAIGFFPVLIIIEKGFTQPIFFLLFLIYLPLLQFAVTPISTMAGIYVYYSPMLSAFVPTGEEIELHNGSSFDYLVKMRKHKPGINFRYMMLYYYLEGLLKLIENIEKKKNLDSVRIVGISYFFNQRTAAKLSFSITGPSLMEKANLLVNFIDLFWMYSLSKGKPSVPNLRKVKKVITDGKTLCENKNKITRWYNFLGKKVKLCNR